MSTQDRPGEEMFRNSFFPNDTVTRTLSGSSARVQLSPGMYLMVSDIDCRFKQGGSAVALADNTKGTPLFAKTYFGPIYVGETADSYVAAIAVSGSGTLEFILVTDKVG